MRICVTGGCGYKGSVLVPKLLAAGHKVTVLDTLWFGNHLAPHENLCVIEADIRHLTTHALAPEGQGAPLDAVIHLASVANDPCGELDGKLTWEVNVLATQRLAEAAVRGRVRQFIFASSASVYGLKGDRAVGEEESLEPVSDYNKTKMCAERVLLSYAHNMAVQIVRPATVCGYSPRMRLDVVVNMLTAQAKAAKRLELMTPHAMRPHIHIEDITDLYLWMLERPGLTGVFNAGFENQTIAQTAERVVHAFGGEMPITYRSDSSDPRSYRLNSDKLLNLGFKPNHTVTDAITDVAKKLDSGELKDEERCHNIRTMQTLLAA